MPERHQDPDQHDLAAERRMTDAEIARAESIVRRVEKTLQGDDTYLTPQGRRRADAVMTAGQTYGWSSPEYKAALDDLMSLRVLTTPDAYTDVRIDADEL